MNYKAIKERIVSDLISLNNSRYENSLNQLEAEILEIQKEKETKKIKEAKCGTQAIIGNIINGHIEVDYLFLLMVDIFLIGALAVSCVFGLVVLDLNFNNGNWIDNIELPIAISFFVYFVLSFIYEGFPTNTCLPIILKEDACINEINEEIDYILKEKERNQLKIQNIFLSSCNVEQNQCVSKEIIEMLPDFFTEDEIKSILSFEKHNGNDVKITYGSIIELIKKKEKEVNVDHIFDQIFLKENNKQ